MAIIENQLARELFVRVGKLGFTLAANGDADGNDRREVDETELLKNPRDGRTVIKDLVDAGSLVILPGSFSSDFTSPIVSQEVAHLPGMVYDEIIDLAGNALVSVPLVTIPVGAVPLYMQLLILETVTGGGTTAKLGLGDGGVDPDLYGLSADLVAATAVNTLVLPFAALGGALDLELNGAAAAGGIGDTAPTVGKVRVRASWIQLDSLSI